MSSLGAKTVNVGEKFNLSNSGCSLGIVQLMPGTFYPHCSAEGGFMPALWHMEAGGGGSRVLDQLE